MERELKREPKMFHPKGNHHMGYCVQHNKIDEHVDHLMILDLKSDAFSLIEIIRMKNAIHIKLIPPTEDGEEVYEGDVYGIDILAPIARIHHLSLDQCILTMTSAGTNHFRTVASIISKKWYISRNSLVVLMGLSLMDEWTLKLFDCALLQSL